MKLVAATGTGHIAKVGKFSPNDFVARSKCAPQKTGPEACFCEVWKIITLHYWNEAGNIWYCPGLCPEKVRSEDDFNLCGLACLERVLDMVAVLGRFISIHKDAAAFPAVAKRQGLGLIGGD